MKNALESEALNDVTWPLYETCVISPSVFGYATAVRRLVALLSFSLTFFFVRLKKASY